MLADSARGPGGLSVPAGAALEPGAQVNCEPENSPDRHCPNVTALGILPNSIDFSVDSLRADIVRTGGCTEVNDVCSELWIFQGCGHVHYLETITIAP